MPSDLILLPPNAQQPRLPPSNIGRPPTYSQSRPVSDSSQCPSSLLRLLPTLAGLSHAQRLPETNGTDVVLRHPQEDGNRAVVVPFLLKNKPRAVGSVISADAVFRARKEDGNRTSTPLFLEEEHDIVGSDASRLVCQTLRGPRPLSHKHRHRDRAISLARDFPRNLPEWLTGEGGFRGWIPWEEPLKSFRRHEEEESRSTEVKKTLAFYKGKPPRGQKTDRIMHEYRLNGAQRREDLKPTNSRDLLHEAR